MEKVTNKVIRFIELSEKFSKSLSQVFPNDAEVGMTSGGYATLTGFSNGGYATLTGFSNGGPCYAGPSTLTVTGTLVLNGREIYVDERTGEVKSKDNKPWTRADEIRAKAEIKAKLSDEFDEYNKLRNELSEYFSALKKITE